MARPQLLAPSDGRPRHPVDAAVQADQPGAPNGATHRGGPNPGVEQLASGHHARLLLSECPDHIIDAGHVARYGRRFWLSPGSATRARGGAGPAFLGGQTGLLALQTPQHRIVRAPTESLWDD